MTTPQTLKVDTALLAKAGQNFSAAAEAVPTAPTPYKPGGADPVSAKILEQGLKVMEPVSTGLPALKAETAKYAGKVSQAANTYASTGGQAADDIGRKSQDLDQAAARASQTGSGDASGAAASGAGGDGMGQFGQLISMGMQMAGQAVQVPMQMAGMASSVPQTVMQVVQQVSQMSGENQGGEDGQQGNQGEAGGPAQGTESAPSAPGAATSDERRDENPVDPSKERQHTDGGAGTTATEKAPESHAAPQTPPVHPRTESAPKTPTEVLL
ncbi:hypothetical protein P5W04_22225 [Mycobacteroides abscessus subsp. abscessus]|uniref:hypothetical protein n=1 Tax=Mycolicibacterium fortuitum TaxID=1766 RepID=UPI000A41D765|nr:hypothetical protein [Mycolicibacterium fortuitum]MDO3242841.1 hypothetical protein [Mycobacteroides abscessus subsp. abscessus]MCA4751395.1 hypothetical protein [Mycolicibacterium fortuitum]MDG5769783.1 hypothetical protein [Mycolicibacterium fortuitum]MDG5784819.1 hypothetical protein [Mycolicibacterium fortuitum]UBV17081.1 hypothetical protein H8Z57_09960 [Mycolicibacterium fortuitum]